MSRIVVTGGAGFLGSHLCEALLRRGDEVIAVDNLCTGDRANLATFSEHPAFRFIEADICRGIDVEGPLDAVANLACPASPPQYFRLGIETLEVGSLGMTAALELAERTGARLLQASTSEVYGDPEVHPQPEGYWGNVNPVGPRSVYDESKRYSEALVTAYRRYRGVNTGLVRIFNTYGPRLAPGDGRVVSNFIAQALAGAPITVYGDGSQTRSFCYVDDLVAGLVAMLDSNEAGPINLGNPDEHSVADLAATVIEMTGSSSEVVYGPRPVDDPAVRRPDITRAQDRLGWQPTVVLADGLKATISWQADLAV